MMRLGADLLTASGRRLAVWRIAFQQSISVTPLPTTPGADEVQAEVEVKRRTSGLAAAHQHEDIASPDIVWRSRAIRFQDFVNVVVRFEERFGGTDRRQREVIFIVRSD